MTRRRLATGVAAAALSTLLSGEVSAHRFPANCTTNGLTVSISRPSQFVNDGDLIPFVVAVEPSTFGIGCQATAVTVSFFAPDNQPNQSTPCTSNNGIPLSSGGSTLFTINPGDAPIIFTAAENPFLNYVVNHLHEIDGDIVAHACALGISHTAPGDPDDAIGNRQITTFVSHPAVTITKSADPPGICEGVPTEVTYSYQVMWDPLAFPPADIPLDNVVVVDDSCGPVQRGDDTPGNDDDLLEEGEIWNYTCTTTISTQTTNMVTVTAEDFRTGLEVTANADFTVTTSPVPVCTIDGPTTACPGAQNLMYTVTGTPGAAFEWTITGDATFCGGGTTAMGPSVCVDADPTCGGFTLDVDVILDGCVGECDHTVLLEDDEPPVIVCPPDLVLPIPLGDPLPPVDVGSVICTDNCGPVSVVHGGDQGGCTGASVATVVRTYRCIDACGNAVECEQIIPIECPQPGDRCCGEKGSLVIFAKVEIRWDGSGILTQDTFLSLLNDWTDPTAVQMYFVNGDPPLPATDGERFHPGWNHVSTEITLTQNEPAYWSALSGQPKGVAPFTILDPAMGGLPGRPDPHGTGRVLRGFVLAWAVNAQNQEVRWNHLSGTGTIVDFASSAAWEYPACTLNVVADVNTGQQTGQDPGVLNLDGVEYGGLGDVLLLDFYTVGAQPFITAPQSIDIDTALTLLPMDVDLRQEDLGPATTKAKVDVWNENEVKFNGLERCITCWDCQLLEHWAGFGIPNNFLRTTIQTNKAKARIDGLQSQNCDFDFDPVDGPLGIHPLDIVSRAAPLVGITSRHLSLEGSVIDHTGINLVCVGDLEPGIVLYDPFGDTPESIYNELMEAIDRARRPAN